MRPCHSTLTGKKRESRRQVRGPCTTSVSRHYLKVQLSKSSTRSDRVTRKRDSASDSVPELIRKPYGEMTPLQESFVLTPYHCHSVPSSFSITFLRTSFDDDTCRHDLRRSQRILHMSYGQSVKGTSTLPDLVNGRVR